MRVLYLTHSTDLSGANRSLLQMILELRETYGVEPFVIIPKVYDNTIRTIQDELTDNKVPYLSHRLSYFQRKKTGILHKIYFIIFSSVYLIHIFLLLHNRKFDLVHSNSSILDVGLYIARLYKIPHVWHFREVASLSFGAKSVLGERYQRFVYSKTDIIIAISKNVVSQFDSLIPLEKTVIVPNGIKPPNVSRYPDHYSDIINICIVGRVEPNKNQMEAIQAIEILPPSIKKMIKLHVVGNCKGEYGQQVVEYISTHHLEDIIIIHGVRTDVSEFLQDMNIGLMLSKHEAFGRVTVEYMMHKMCVVATNTSANPEIISNEENGLLYEIGNPQELADTIMSIINDRGRMKRLSDKGYEDAMRRYVSTTNSDRVFALYKDLCKG